MTDREICKNEYEAIKSICDFFFDRAIDVSGREPNRNPKALATYAKWREREAKAHRIYTAHLWS